MKKGKHGSSWRPGVRGRFSKGRDSERGRDYETGRQGRRRDGDDGSQDDRRSPKRRKKEGRSRSKRREMDDDREYDRQIIKILPNLAQFSTCLGMLSCK